MERGFGEVRSVLYGPPTQDGWELLCELLDVLKDEPGTDLEALIYYVGQGLERWPSSLRVMPKRWLMRLMSGHRVALASLARVIDLSRKYPDEAQLKALAACEVMEQIEELDLSVSIRESSLEALMVSARLTRLKVLRLASNALSAGFSSSDPARWLRASACAPTLERLVLGFNHIGNDYLEALASVEGLRALVELNLYGNHITRAAPLLTSRRFERLERLDLKWNRLEDLAEGLEGCALHQLRALDLTATGLDDRAARALAEAQVMTRLTSLKLGENAALGDAGMQALAGARWMERLETLSLAATGVHAAGLAMLAESGRLGRVTQLNLTGARGVDDAALEVLSRPGALPALRRLNLGHTSITARGVLALTQAEWADKLEMLQLDHCPIGDDGALALAECERLGALRQLSLSGNKISDEGALMLSQASWLTALDEGFTFYASDVGPETWLIMSTSARAGEGLKRRWRAYGGG